MLRNQRQVTITSRYLLLLNFKLLLLLQFLLPLLLFKLLRILSLLKLSLLQLCLFLFLLYTPLDKPIQIPTSANQHEINFTEPPIHQIMTVVTKGGKYIIKGRRKTQVHKSPHLFSLHSLCLSTCCSCSFLALPSSKHAYTGHFVSTCRRYSGRCSRCCRCTRAGRVGTRRNGKSREGMCKASCPQQRSLLAKRTL